MKINVKYVDTSKTSFWAELRHYAGWAVIVAVVACTLVVVGYKWAESMVSASNGSYVTVANQNQLSYDGFTPLDRNNPPLDLEKAINSGGLEVRSSSTLRAQDNNETWRNANVWSQSTINPQEVGKNVN